MKISKVFVIAASAACIFFSACTINKPQEETRKITVKGAGTVLADQTVLTFEIRARDMDQSVCEASVSETAGKIQNAVSVFGQEAVSVSVSGNQVSTEKGQKIWVKNEDGEWIGKDDYTVILNSVKITVKDISKTKPVSEAVLKACGNAAVLKAVNYKAAESGSELRQARMLAIQNAQDTANFLAGASGCKVNKVLEITEDETVFKSTDVKSIMPQGNTDLLGIVTDANVSVTANVTITYSLIN